MPNYVGHYTDCYLMIWITKFCLWCLEQQSLLPSSFTLKTLLGIFFPPIRHKAFQTNFGNESFVEQCLALQRMSLMFYTTKFYWWCLAILSSTTKFAEKVFGITKFADIFFSALHGFSNAVWQCMISCVMFGIMKVAG